MSLVLPPLFHWSPHTAHEGIRRRGLRPSCPTASAHHDEGTVLAVCLGTSPSHAWWLSGNARDTCGGTWDLWQVILDEADDVHVLPSLGVDGHRLGEVRVANRIPKSRVWYVASRTT